MKKVYEAPAMEPILFRPIENLSANWIDLNSGIGSKQPQDGAITSEGDIIIKLY